MCACINKGLQMTPLFLFDYSFGEAGRKEGSDGPDVASQES